MGWAYSVDPENFLSRQFLEAEPGVWLMSVAGVPNFVPCISKSWLVGRSTSLGRSVFVQLAELMYVSKSMVHQQANPQPSLSSSCLKLTHISVSVSLKMVLLTMTPSIVEGLSTLSNDAHSQQKKVPPLKNEPSLDSAAVGNPVSHSQVIDIWTALRDAGNRRYTLETLLRGSKVYVPPPPPKPEPVS